MLSYALAIAVAISSLILFSTAFFMSKIHRKDDFLWSAVGLFYALILWFCARNITGTVLLGQAAATVLITSYCWQTIKLRKAIANPAQAAEINNFSVVNKINSLLKRKPKLDSPAPVVKPPTPKVTEQEIAIPKTPVSTPQTSPAPIPTAEEPAKSDRVVPSRSTQNIKPTESKNNFEVTQLQPLPDKLPEIARPLSEEKPQPESNTPPVEPVNNLKTEVTEAASLTPQTTTDTVKEENSVSQPKAEPKPEVTTPEVKKSSFDSLETVEVAEVLEAEDNAGDRGESDRDNIIEVTTTEINVVTETTKIDLDRVDNSDPQET